MDKREIIVVAVVVVIVIVAGAGIYYWSSGNNKTGSSTSVPAAGTAGSVGAPGVGTVLSATTSIQSLPSNVVVPVQNASSVPAGVAAPSIVTPGSPSGSTSYRSFSISISGGAYTPNTVIVNQGDTVHISLTAVDGNYDFTQPNYGLSLAIAKGQSKVVQFDADTAGKFTFYCASCGGPTKGPTGYIEVVAK
jgi:heme/copper-type cytochrome/quinol oxidase subunit 2